MYPWLSTNVNMHRWYNHYRQVIIWASWDIFGLYIERFNNPISSVTTDPELTRVLDLLVVYVVKSWHWEAFRNTVALWRKSMHAQKSCYANPWCFPCHKPQRAFERTVETLLTWDALMVTWHHWSWGNTLNFDFTLVEIKCEKLNIRVVCVSWRRAGADHIIDIMKSI